MEGRKEIDIDAYLERIYIYRGYQFWLSPTGLELLQRRHLQSVPFENLDIHWGRRIDTNVERFYTKIVEEGRGGFCYELNGLFIELLRDFGFTARLVSARVARPDGTFTDEFDHAAIVVTLGAEEYLVDVGFGSFAASPLRIAFREEQTDSTGTYTFRQHDGEYIEVAKQNGDGWQSEYIFTLAERDLSEFAARCAWQQDSPESHFKKGKLCSIMTENGRKTLTDTSFIVTDGDLRKEASVESEQDFYDVLQREFSITQGRGLYA